ncbi:transposase [Shuttleworthella sp. MSX8B]|uniref:transposase n=1 Tax=Shuttleworthella sp. MSX8B TaxID=936574 RepID=UPI0018DDEA1E|nr:transposase [Shuttleworthia sp. MSX8B]
MYFITFWTYFHILYTATPSHTGEYPIGQSSWHFIRNILARIPHRQKKSVAGGLKSICLAPDDTVARERAEAFIEKYRKRFSEAVHCLEDSLTALLNQTIA